MLRSCVAVAALLAWTGSAGSGDPVMIRTVTMNGIVGAAYYSTVEQGYRFVGRSPRITPDSADAADAPIAVSSLEAADEAAVDAAPDMVVPETADAGVGPTGDAIEPPLQGS